MEGEEVKGKGSEDDMNNHYLITPTGKYVVCSMDCNFSSLSMAQKKIMLFCASFTLAYD